MWIKICGVTNLDEALSIAALGADAIGLNFYSNTPRCIPVNRAAAITAALPETIEPVGLFVNHPASEIEAICDACGIRTIQLHGDEPPELAAELAVDAAGAPRRIIRAFRVGEEGLEGLRRELSRYWELSVTLTGCLVDAHVSGRYGGTGRQAPWELLSREWEPAWPPLILAGGLTPENVGKAVETVRPWGVDVASGVERAPGCKDLEKVRRLIAAVRTTEC
jgi:phosphoribosylanthranilate isomerase